MSCRDDGMAKSPFLVSLLSLASMPEFVDPIPPNISFAEITVAPFGVPNAPK